MCYKPLNREEGLVDDDQPWNLLEGLEYRLSSDEGRA